MSLNTNNKSSSSIAVEYTKPNENIFHSHIYYKEINLIKLRAMLFCKYIPDDLRNHLIQKYVPINSRIVPTSNPLISSVIVFKMICKYVPTRKVVKLLREYVPEKEYLKINENMELYKFVKVINVESNLKIKLCKSNNNKNVESNPTMPCPEYANDGNVESNLRTKLCKCNNDQNNSIIPYLEYDNNEYVNRELRMKLYSKYINIDPHINISRVNELENCNKLKLQGYEYIHNFIKSVKTYENFKNVIDIINNTVENVEDINLPNVTFLSEDDNSELSSNENNSSGNRLFANKLYETLENYHRCSPPISLRYKLKRSELLDKHNIMLQRFKRLEEDLKKKATQLNECIITIYSKKSDIP
jgi:hypothetical protein